MISPAVLEFLTQLKENNNREWFQAHKPAYEKVKKEVEAFVASVIVEVAKFDKSIGLLDAKDCMFRIFRDVRFSPDKSPYKTNIGGFITQGGRKGLNAGYYIHFEPGTCMLAGGVYMPRPDVLKLLRNEVYFHSNEFKAILNKPSFKKLFGDLDDFDKLKKAPKDFPADFPDVDLLKYKSYSVLHTVSDDRILAADYKDYAASVFREMYPFNDFLNRAIANG